MSWQATDFVTKNSQQSGTALLVLLVVAAHAHADGTGAWASVRTIAKEARVHERTAQRILAALMACGELVRDKRPGRYGSYSYTILGVALQQLALPMPVEPSAKVVPIKSRGDILGNKGWRGRRSGVTNLELRGDTAVSPKPRVEPPVEPPEEPTRAERAKASWASKEIPTRTATEKEIEREHHRFGKLAEEHWLNLGRERGTPYITRSHLRQVHQLAIESLRWADEGQVLDGMAKYMTHESAPVRIPEWSRLVAAEEQTQDHIDIALDERDQMDRIVIHKGLEGQVTRWLGHVPELSGDVCQLKGCGRSAAEHRLATSAKLRPLGPTVNRVVREIDGRSA